MTSVDKALSLAHQFGAQVEVRTRQSFRGQRQTGYKVRIYMQHEGWSASSETQQIDDVGAMILAVMEKEYPTFDFATWYENKT